MSVTDDILASYAPLLNTDSEAYLTALAGMFEQIFGIVADQGYADDADWVPGWGTLLDPDTCPAAFLPFLSQFNGTGVTIGYDDYADTITSDHPLAWWRLDEPPSTSATTAADSAGSYPGTYVGPQLPNLIVNSSFETNVTGWTASNCAVAQGGMGTGASHLLHAAKLTSSASGDMNINIDAVGQRLPATAQVQYTASATFFTGGTSRTCQVIMYFQDASGSRLSTTNGATITDNNTSGGIKATVTGIAPATTATVSIALVVKATAAANEVHYLDSVTLRIGTSTVFSTGLGVALGQTGALTADPDTGVGFDESGYVSVPYAAALNPSKFSVETWFKAGSTCTIFGSGDGYTYGFALQNSGANLTWRIGSGSDNDLTVSTGVLSTTGWNHIVLTYDGTTFVAYVNGNLVNSKALVFGPNTSQAFTIGPPLSGGSGSWDETAIYNYPLTLEQVRTHYLAGTTPSARSIVKSEVGFGRGTPAGIIQAAQTYLTGAKNVQIIERLADGGTLDAWHFQLIVKTSEVVDATKLTAAVNAVKPAGLTWTLVSTTGHPWSTASKIWSNETVSWADTDNVAI